MATIFLHPTIIPLSENNPCMHKFYHQKTTQIMWLLASFPPFPLHLHTFKRTRGRKSAFALIILFYKPKSSTLWQSHIWDSKYNHAPQKTNPNEKQKVKCSTLFREGPLTTIRHSLSTPYFQTPQSAYKPSLSQSTPPCRKAAGHRPCPTMPVATTG